jgi:xylan 1,4-beta-xylosidase
MQTSDSVENEVVIHEEGIPFKAFFQNLKSSPFHYHEDMEFLLVLKGQISLQKDNSIFDLGPGDLALINSHNYHSTSALGMSSDNLILTLQIQPEFIEQYEPDIKKMRFNFTSKPDILGKGSPSEETVKKIRSSICTIMWEKRTKNNGYKMAIISSLFSILTTLLREVEYETVSDQYSLSNQEFKAIHSRLNRIVKHIEENYQENPTLEELSLQENISNSYLSRFFKKYMNCGFRDYLNTFRLNKALQLLIETDMNITDIAFEVGFSNLNTLNSLFHKHHGTTPSKWRQIHKQPFSNNSDRIGWYETIDNQSPMDSIFKYMI